MHSRRSSRAGYATCQRGRRGVSRRAMHAVRAERGAILAHLFDPMAKLEHRSVERLPVHL